MTEQLGLGLGADYHGIGDELERAWTPTWAAAGIVEALAAELLPCVDLVIEPHAGGGALLREASHYWPDAARWAFDLDPHAPALDDHSLDRAELADWLTDPARNDLERWRVLLDRRLDVLVLGNPPFSDALDHLDVAVRLGAWVAFVLPLDRLERSSWSTWLDAHPPTWWRPLRPRPWPDRVQGTVLAVWPPNNGAAHGFTNVRQLALK